MSDKAFLDWYPFTFDPEFNGIALDAWNAATALKDAEIAALKDTLEFVERWANHHGTKAHMTAAEALGCIQHHPAIRAITKSYADGKVPDTHDPYAEIAALKADAGRYRYLRGFERVTVATETEDLVWSSCFETRDGLDDAIDEAIAHAVQS